MLLYFAFEETKFRTPGTILSFYLGFLFYFKKNNIVRNFKEELLVMFLYRIKKLKMILTFFNKNTAEQFSLSGSLRF